MQGVCSHNKQFIYVDAGSPGSMHDSRVFKTSSLYKAIQERKNEIFPHNSHLIGDTAYQISDWLMVPFKRYGDLTIAQKKIQQEIISVSCDY